MRTMFLVAGLAATLVCGCRGSVGSNPVEGQHSDPSDKQTPPGRTLPGKEAGTVKEQRSGKWSPDLSAEEKQTLFAIAESTLRWCVNGQRGAYSFEEYELTPKLEEPTATFVTLKVGDKLRGCIGSLAPVAPMYRSVHDNAVNASMKDFRFSPVTPAELQKIDVHISLLSPIVAIASLEEFRLGEHGIILEKGRYRAVFLPEVAPEQGWDEQQTLAHLSAKAGMNPDGWREGARFRVFSSVVLSK